MNYYQQLHQHYPSYPNPPNPPNPKIVSEGKRKKCIAKIKTPVVQSEEEMMSESDDEDMRQQLKEFFKHSNDHRTQIQENSQKPEDKYQYPGNSDRPERLRQLYGDSMVDVMRQEAKMSLMYEKYCDENQPVLWPVLPIRLG